MVYIHNGIVFGHKKEWNNAICSNMDGPRDYHTKWSKSDGERQISYHLYVESKIWQKWTYVQNRNRLTDIENRRVVAKGERQERDKLGAWDWQIYTTIHRIDNQQGPTVYHRELYSISCNDL